MENYINTVFKVVAENVKVVNDASVTVKIAETDTLATIYSDNGVTVKNNPIQADQDTGSFEFFAANGRYDIEVESAGNATGILSGVVLYDPDDDQTLSVSDIGVSVQGYDAATAKTDEANTWAELQTFKGTKDTIHTIEDGSSVDIDPANGDIQVWTLGDNRTPTATNFDNGQSVTLMIDDGSAYAITWTIVDKWFGGAPTLSTDELTGIVLFKVGGVMYGAALPEVAA